MSAALRCGVLGLSVAETALIRTLFKLYQHGSGDFRWTLADAAPYDALLVDAAVDITSARTLAAADTILTIGSAALAGQPDALARPLRSEMLEAWLLRTQRRLLAAGQAPEAPVHRPAAIALPATLSAILSATAVPDPMPSAKPVATPADTGMHKLTRWPPAAMLRNDPTLIRMATMLARRPIKVSDLAQACQQPVDAASAFVFALRDAGLLEKAAPSPLPRPARAPIGAARPTHVPAKLQRSLVSRIRLRLGF